MSSQSGAMHTRAGSERRAWLSRDSTVQLDNKKVDNKKVAFCQKMLFRQWCFCSDREHYVDNWRNRLYSLWITLWKLLLHNFQLKIYMFFL